MSFRCAHACDKNIFGYIVYIKIIILNGNILKKYKNYHYIIADTTILLVQYLD